MMLKLLFSIVCPVCWMCAWMGEVVLDVLCTFPQGSWMSLLCIPHHMLCWCIGNYRWFHFSFPWGPGPWVSLVIVLLLCCPWSVLGYHTYHIWFWSLWLFLVCMGWLPVLCGFGCFLLLLSVLSLILDHWLVGPGCCFCCHFPQLLLRTFLCTLFMAQVGYLHFPIASLRCLTSLSRNSGLVQTVFALWVSVPMTLYLADRLWWLSHCKY